MNNIMQRHICSKDPVQAAYTAGVFWLFQNAVITRFYGQSHVDLVACVASALITFVGCVLVVVIAVLLPNGLAQTNVDLSTSFRPKKSQERSSTRASIHSPGEHSCGRK